VGPNGVDLADWDYLSKPARFGFVIQAVCAVAFVPLGLYVALARHVWLGWVMTFFSLGWMAYQYNGYRQLLAYRRAGG
jgi:hypothetical protein